MKFIIDPEIKKQSLKNTYKITVHLEDYRGSDDEYTRVSDNLLDIEFLYRAYSLVLGKNIKSNRWKKNLRFLTKEYIDKGCPFILSQLCDEANKPSYTVDFIDTFFDVIQDDSERGSPVEYKNVHRIEISYFDENSNEHHVRPVYTITVFNSRTGRVEEVDRDEFFESVIFPMRRAIFPKQIASQIKITIPSKYKVFKEIKSKKKRK